MQRAVERRATKTASHFCSSPLLLLCLTIFPGSSSADEALVTFGKGPQPGADQRHATLGLDFNFHTFERSDRQHIVIGVSYTQLEANARGNADIYALSIYPQLSFFPPDTSRIAARFPANVEPFFFVRALGPTYISENHIGSRLQGSHFSFHAQFGVGILVGLRPGGRFIATLSWKHYSNANLHSDNDGFDVPAVVSFGVEF